MRLGRFVLVVIFALISGVTFGQIATDEISPERDPAKSVHIFPNPAVEYVSIRLADVSVTKMKLAVMNILGTTMESETEVIDEHELRVKVKDLPAGYYFLALKDEKTQYRGTFKFLKR
jgi:hypothetical protein